MMKVDLNKITLEKEKITIRGKELIFYKPACLEEIFVGDPFYEVEKFPFWVKIWEASIVLADYIATLKPPLELLELGAGLGISSLVAASFGHKVLATDKEELPLKLLEKSAKENNLSLTTKTISWLSPEFSQRFDIIMGSEIIFNQSLFEPLLQLFKTYLKPKGKIILSHSAERKRILIPFLYKAQKSFEIQTSIKKLKGENETWEIILNKLLPKDAG